MSLQQRKYELKLMLFWNGLDCDTGDAEVEKDTKRGGEQAGCEWRCELSSLVENRRTNSTVWFSVERSDDLMKHCGTGGRPKTQQATTKHTSTPKFVDQGIMQLVTQTHRRSNAQGLNTTYFLKKWGLYLQSERFLLHKPQAKINIWAGATPKELLICLVLNTHSSGSSIHARSGSISICIQTFATAIFKKTTYLLYIYLYLCKQHFPTCAAHRES